MVLFLRRFDERNTHFLVLLWNTFHSQKMIHHQHYYFHEKLQYSNETFLFDDVLLLIVHYSHMVVAVVPTVGVAWRCEYCCIEEVFEDEYHDRNGLQVVVGNRCTTVAVEVPNPAIDLVVVQNIQDVTLCLCSI